MPHVAITHTATSHSSTASEPPQSLPGIHHFMASLLVEQMVGRPNGAWMCAR